MSQALRSTLCFIAILVAGQTHAALVEWSVTGTVRAVTGPLASYFDLSVGDEMSAVFVVETGTPGTVYGPNVFFEQAVVSATLSAGSLQTQFDPQPSELNHIAIRNSTFDALAIAAPLITSGIPGVASAFVAMTLWDTDGQILDDDSFPTLPALSDLAPFSFTGATSNFYFDANASATPSLINTEITALSARTIVTTVPLPGALLYMAWAVIGLAPLRRR